jgi:hypothetical protein
MGRCFRAVELVGLTVGVMWALAGAVETAGGIWYRRLVARQT